ncbi:MAG TPA: ABC transporter permease [Thermoanaerobaculia bacterium]|nr:ABC transporter permease [Thermoanaerobaculia bacterium]
MSELAQDVRHALRSFAKNPGFTAAAVSSFALGIGANTLIFTFLNALFLAPLPVKDPDRLVALYSTDPQNPGLLPLSYANFADLTEGEGTFADASVHRSIAVSLGEGDGAELIPGELVSGEFFDVLGLEPERGRFFLPEEDAKPGVGAVAVLSDGLWRRRFGGAPGAVGRTIRLNGRAFTVVGIAPRDFKGLSLLDEPPQLWVPTSMYREVLDGPPAKGFMRRGSRQLEVVARLAPGIGIDAARAALEAKARELERTFPDANRGQRFVALPLAKAVIDPSLRGGLVRSGGLLATVVGLLLLISGANVANLLLGRALARRRETSVRLALGAGRGRLARQLLTEGALLALAGGALGLALARWGKAVLWALRPPFFPDSLDPRLDLRILGFTFAVSLVTGLVFGLAPLLQSFRLDLARELTHGSGALGAAARGGAGSRLRALLVAAQVALSLVVLVGAGLFLRSLQKIEGIDPGFERDKLFTIPVDLATQGLDEPRGQEFYRRVVERIDNLPGVASATVSSRFLLMEAGQRSAVVPEGADAGASAEGVLLPADRVGPRYFETTRIRLLAGREFTPADRTGTPQVAVVNESLARWLWPGQPALGKRFRWTGDPVPTEIVGVAADARIVAPGVPPSPNIYVPLEQNYAPGMLILVRTTGAPEPVVPAVRAEILGLLHGLPLHEARTIDQVRRRVLWAPKMGAGLLAVFGFLATALAALGIYGVTSYATRQRDREIGLRMALGADRGAVRNLVIAQGLRPAILGLALGLALAFVLSRIVSSLLFGVSPNDPPAFAAAALVLAAIALAAVFVPAHRASGLDPAAALRTS